jgi:pimeloyl-ACP methyl ester carboxylesterase
MSAQNVTVLLVHRAFAESASWNPGDLLAPGGVRRRRVPLPSVSDDAAYLRDVITGIGTSIVLVGHCYGGLVITEAAADNDAVVALVYAAAFVPEQGESAHQLSSKFPGSTLGAALVASPVSKGTREVAGASHAVSVGAPDQVTAAILDAVGATSC